MLSSLQEEDNSFEFIINAINQYNNGKKKEDTLKLIYTGTSAQLSYLGKRATISKPKESEILTIPFALIPARTMQKKYGIYSFSENILGKRNNAKFRHKLYSLPLGPSGHARYHATIADIKNAHKIKHVQKQVLELIMQIQAHNYIRSLKKLMVSLTAMMMLDPPDPEKIQHYLTLIKKENEHLKQQFLHDSNKMLSIQKYFDKYFPRFQSILQGALPFEADDKFRDEIIDQYPIIFCSTANQDLVEEQGELAYNGELCIKTVKLLFAPKRYVSKLKNKLQEIGLDQIEVIAFDNDIVARKTAPRGKHQDAFLNADTCDAMIDALHHDPELLLNRAFVSEKLKRCLQSFSESNNRESFLMAAWLLKHSSVDALTDVEALIKQHANLLLAELIQTKFSNDKHYHSVVSELVPDYYVSHVNQFSYIKALHLFRQAIENCSTIFDYSKECSHEELHQNLEPQDTTARDAYIHEYLQRLQNLYLVLTRDIGESIQNEANIKLRLAFIRNKYVELLDEYKSLRSSQEITDSELYLWVSGLQNENKKILVSGLLVQVGQSSPATKSKLNENSH